MRTAPSPQPVRPNAPFQNIVFLTAFFARLAYLFYLKFQYFFFKNPGSDVRYYLEWAREIAGGNVLGEKVFNGLPLFPYYLGVLMNLTLRLPFLLWLVNILLGSFNCVLIYLIAQKIFDERTARLTAILCALNFMMVYYSWLLMPVTLLTTLGLLIIHLLTEKDRLLRSRDFLGLGSLLGLATLGDGKFLFFSVMCSLLVFVRDPAVPFDRRAVRSLLIMTGVVTMLFGVCLRNKIVSGDWVMISAQSGLSLYAGNNPQSDGIYENPDFIRPDHRGQDEDQKIMAERFAQRNLSPGEVSAFWRARAVSFMTQQPGQFLILLTRKFLAFFRQEERSFDIDLLLLEKSRRVLDLNPFYVIMPLSLWGMFLSWKKRLAHPAFLLVLSQLLVTMIFFLTNRHRATILPVLIMFESAALLWCFDLLRDRKFHGLAWPAGLLIAFVLLLPPTSLDSQTRKFIENAKRGPVWERRGEYKKAEAHYLRALQLRPGDANSWYNLGNAYLLQDRDKEAESAYEKAVEICPSQVDALFNLGVVRERAGDWQAAKGSFGKVLELQPDSLDSLLRLGAIAAEQGDCSVARDYSARILELKPELAAEIRSFFAVCLDPQP